MKFPLYLYKNLPNYTEIYLEDEDTLIWSGIGGAVTLSLKDMKRWIKQADMKLKQSSQSKENSHSQEQYK